MKKKKQAGSGLDIQKWISKSGREWHWPGYQYMGPGTHLKKRLQRGDPGINRLDRIAKQHDIDYSRAKTLKDKHVADRKMIRAIDHLPGPQEHDGTCGQENHVSQDTFKSVKNSFIGGEILKQIET